MQSLEDKVYQGHGRSGLFIREWWLFCYLISSNFCELVFDILYLVLIIPLYYRYTFLTTYSYTPSNMSIKPWTLCVPDFQELSEHCQYCHNYKLLLLLSLCLPLMLLSLLNFPWHSSNNALCWICRIITARTSHTLLLKVWVTVIV